MISLKFSVGGIEVKMGVLAKAVKDLEPALRNFDQYYRLDVAKRFAEQGPGWPERKQSTMSGQAARTSKKVAVSRLRMKLTRDLKRAARSYNRGKGSQSTVARRYAVLKEFEKQHLGLITQSFAGLAPASGPVAGDKRLEKSVTGLKERMARATAKSSKSLLGKLPSSMFSKISAGTLTVSSKVPWAGVHNKGGTAGHGAKIPARPFNYLTPENIEVFVEILRNRMLLALAG